MSDEKQDKKIQAYVMNRGPSSFASYAGQGARESQRLTTRETRALKQQGVVVPPMNLKSLANLLDSCTWAGKAARTIAKDTIGRGWFLEAQFSEDDKPETADAEYELLYRFFETASVETGEPLEQTQEKAILDLVGIGNGYLELIREDKARGKPVALAHMPGVSVYAHQDGDKFVQKVGTKSRWFKRAGAEIDVDKDTGKTAGLGSMEYSLRATELIPLRLYTPRSEFYGLPPIVTALGASLLWQSQMNYNIAFFENNAIPQYAVIIEGGGLEEETEAVIRDFFETTAKEQPHSTLVLTVPPSEPGMQESKIRFEKLAAEVKEGSFEKLALNARNEILSALAVPGYRLGLAEQGSLGGTTIREADEIYKYEEVGPISRQLENVINTFVVRKGFGIENWSWKLHEMDVSDEMRQVEYYDKQFQDGVITPNDFREAMGYDRIDDPALDEHYLRGIPIHQLSLGSLDAATKAINEEMEKVLPGRISQSMKGNDGSSKRE